MKVFAISDLHLSINNPKPMDIFGSRWDNYVEKIYKNWQNIIKPEDTVVIGGDISWGMNLKQAKEDFAFLHSLPGKKLILKGNHDYWWGTAKKMKEFFEQHMKDTIKHLYNHPSVVAYTIFNEGWGQFDGDRMYGIAKKMDSTRLYDATSGWFIQNDSDFDSFHIYFGNKKLNPKERPLFLSEFGGYTYKVDGHVFNEKKTYGYGTCKSKEELMNRIVARYENLLLPAVSKGACGCVYTQLSDVEDEINGLYTYDRKVCKVVKEDMLAMSEKLYAQLEN